MDCFLGCFAAFSKGPLRPSWKFTSKVLREHLRKNGVLSEDILPCNLDNDIHPIFARNNWPTKNFVYENWEPALRLASLFLTEGSVMGWWVQAALGEPCSDEALEHHFVQWALPETDATGNISLAMPILQFWRDIRHHWRTNQPEPFQLCEVENTKENRRITRAKLHRLASNVKFSRKPIMESAWGVTISCVAGHSRIQLCKAIWKFHAMSWQERAKKFTEQLCLFITFMTAVTLCHEVAHAFCHTRKAEMASIDVRRASLEPYLCLAEQDGGPEAGFSWERSVFRGILGLHDWRRGIRSPNRGWEFGLVLQKSGMTEAGLQGRETRFVRSEWVNFWVRKENWEKIRQEGFGALPNIGDIVRKDHVFHFGKGLLHLPFVLTRGDEKAAEKIKKKRKE